jgi:homoserine O-acetyltransferase/O-succinyltransferase
MPNIFKHQKPFTLENGATLSNLEIAYHTYGTLNNTKSNVIWVCHALTANSDVFDWWPGLFGENDLYNPNDYFIVCANNLGSCYGSTSPLSIDNATHKPYYSNFPLTTMKDMAASFELLRLHLGLEKIHTLIGGSQGGQIALEWALLKNDVFENLILLATNAQHSPWAIAFNESQRLAIFADETYDQNIKGAAKKGLTAARSIALLSYRYYDTYNLTQKENNNQKANNFLASSYQQYQGKKLVERFNAYSYVTLLNAMDSHNVGRNRKETIANVLKSIQANTLVIGLSTDILFPVVEQQFLAKHIISAQYVAIDSIYGHDGFLIETNAIKVAIQEFYKTAITKSRNKNCA